MSARRAAVLLGSVGLHVAALALLTLVAVTPGFPPTLVVDLSAWEHAAAKRPPGMALRRAPDDRAAGGAEPSVPADQSARRGDATPMAESAPANPPIAAASTPPLSLGETRPPRDLAGSGERERERRADSPSAPPATHPPGVSAGASGSQAAASPAAFSAPRGSAGAGAEAPGGGGTGVMSAGHGGGQGPGVSGGSRLALALPGEGRGSVPAEYGPYLARFRQRVQDALVYPLAARRRGLSGTVEIEVLIEPGGRVQNVAVSSSSSHALLDEAAADTVRQMAPVPMPETLPARPLRVKLPLVFELR